VRQLQALVPDPSEAVSPIVADHQAWVVVVGPLSGVGAAVHRPQRHPARWSRLGSGSVCYQFVFTDYIASAPAAPAITRLVKQYEERQPP
jgi:hypothetical protein